MWVCSHLQPFQLKFHIQLQTLNSPPTTTTTNKFPQFPSTSLNPNPPSNKPTRFKLNSAQTTHSNSYPTDEPRRPTTSFDELLELKRGSEKGDDELVPIEGLRGGGEGAGGLGVRGGRKQLMRRSGLLAKQVISIRTARSLGFVSQLWVDTTAWVVVLIEVRPNLLSGDIEKFRLEDVCQVGDVVLVPDESVTENELQMIGLDTLVGYNVVTSGRLNVGKVRGYTFDINSGAVESLEFDSFGFSIIPASLVSTYCLLVEDMLEVTSDTVVIQEDATSRVQRLTKGIWDTQNVDKSGDDMDEFYDFGRQNIRPVRSQSNRDFKGRKFPRRKRVEDDDWELPMDY